LLIRLLALGAAGTAAMTAAWAGIHVVRDAHAHWGVDPAESERAMPGDDLVDVPDAIDTRVIDIDAPIDAVWPWLVQMGYGRAGWYSYDLFDMDVPSALTVEQRWQSLAVGDILPTHPGGGFEVKVLEAPRSMVLYLDRAMVDAQEHAAKHDPSDRPGGVSAATANVRATSTYLSQTVQGDFAASWAFQLEPRGDGRSRLVERFRVRMQAPEKGQGAMRLARGFLGFGVFVMTRRHMLGVKDRAEGRFGADRRSFPIHPGTHVGAAPDAQVRPAEAMAAPA
jgi:hypothetical protein